ncbi:MAG: hypothetical protein PHU66_10310 [Bacteroidaceae bacterium]|nr:hypothetical protein [Bacteroidaceae bacterium]
MLEEILKYSIGGITLSGALVYLIKSIVNNLVNRNFEAYKYKLTSENEIYRLNIEKDIEKFKLTLNKEIEAYRHELERMNLEHQIKFSKIYELETEKLEELNEKMLTIEKNVMFIYQSLEFEEKLDYKSIMDKIYEINNINDWFEHNKSKINTNIIKLVEFILDRVVLEFIGNVMSSIIIKEYNLPDEVASFYKQHYTKQFDKNVLIELGKVITNKQMTYVRQVINEFTLHRLGIQYDKRFS